jgi:hypothetical protein
MANGLKFLYNNHLFKASNSMSLHTMFTIDRLIFTEGDRHTGITRLPLSNILSFSKDTFFYFINSFVPVLIISLLCHEFWKIFPHKR